MALSLDAAAEVFREAMRDTVKRYSLWYLIQGVLLIAAGVLAIIYPVLSSAAVIVLLGWLLIISGVVQGLSLIGARHVPHFWLQLISVILAVLIGCLFLRDPAQGLVTIALLLIVFFMIEGISKVVFALTIRPFPNWGWVLASGLVGDPAAADPVGEPAGHGPVAGRGSARHQPDQRGRGDRLSRLAGTAELRPLPLHQCTGVSPNRSRPEDVPRAGLTLCPAISRPATRPPIISSVSPSSIGVDGQRRKFRLTKRRTIIQGSKHGATSSEKTAWYM